MLTLLDPFFWLNFAYFCLAIFVSFYIPGLFFVKKLNLSAFQSITISLIVGMVMWAFQGFILGYLNLRILTYFYLGIFLFLEFNDSNKKHVFKFINSLKNIKIDKTILLIIILGVVIQLSTIWFFGLKNNNGLILCCGDASDNLYHIALTNQLIQRIPPFEPGMFGTTVHNYHYLSNLVTAELSRVFNLPLLYTQFQYSTLFISLMLGLSALVFGQILGIGKIYSRWLLFFLYFGGDLVFLILSILTKNLNFSMSSLEDGAKFLANPPRAFSIVVFFTGLSLLSIYIKNKNIRAGLLLALVFGSLIGFKIYTGIFALCGLGALAAYYILVKRKYLLVLPFILCLFLSLIIYLPVNSSAGGLYFTGLWRFENLAAQHAFGLDYINNAFQIYVTHKNWPRILQYELIFISLYFFAIFGTKLIGFIQTKKSLSLIPREINIFLISGILTSLIAGLFFEQKTGGSNTFNFVVSAFIIGSIYTALTCFYFLQKFNKKTKYFLIIIIVLLTIPRAGYQLMTNMRVVFENKLILENSKIEAFSFINKNTNKDSLVLVDGNYFGLGASTPYISFFTNRPMYLTGEGILRSHRINITDRENISRIILTSSDSAKIEQSITKSGIKYIITSNSISYLSTSSARLRSVFENNEIKILQYDND